MVMIGVDSHKRTHTAVVLDEVGRRLAEKTVATATEGHLALVAWARQWPQVSFALEDFRHLTRRLDRDLLGAGHRVIRVSTRLMAGARRAGRRPGKSDPIDAEAVAGRATAPGRAQFAALAALAARDAMAANLAAAGLVR